EVIARIERAAKPWIAALHGAALGGGLELALGCRLRIAAPGTRLALPETGLGLIPGAGGTQRLPRLIGAAAALEMVAEGKALTAEDAAGTGLVDRIAEEPRAAALALAEALPGLPPPAADRPAADLTEAEWQEA